MANSIRQNRTRYKLKKVTNRKRLTVFRSNNHIYAQIINDDKGITLASASSIEKIFRENNHSKKELAEKIGTEIAKRSIKNGVDAQITHRIWKSIIWSYVDFQKRKFKKK